MNFRGLERIDAEHQCKAGRRPWRCHTTKSLNLPSSRSLTTRRSGGTGARSATPSKWRAASPTPTRPSRRTDYRLMGRPKRPRRSGAGDGASCASIRSRAVYLKSENKHDVDDDNWWKPWRRGQGGGEGSKSLPVCLEGAFLMKVLVRDSFGIELNKSGGGGGGGTSPNKRGTML